MKLTSVEIHPSNASVVAPVVLSFRDPNRLNKFNVKAIEGLDAEEILPGYYATAGGKKYYDLMLSKRQIVVVIELAPNYTINETPSTLRDNLYKMISSSRTGAVELKFKNGATILAVISGFVTKLEANLFDKAPEVKLTIQCSEPMLKAPDPIGYDVSGWNQQLKNIPDTVSTAPHGFRLGMYIQSVLLQEFTIQGQNEDWSFGVYSPPGGFLFADIIRISSEHNNKYVQLQRGGNFYEIANLVRQGSVWPIMFPGDNWFIFGANANYLAWESVLFYPCFWGV